MKPLPILFKPEMVKAIIQGEKTQTRRLNGLDIFNENPDLWRFESLVKHGDKGKVYTHAWFEDLDPNSNKKGSLFSRKPQYQGGDILWVRETWTTKHDRVYFKASDPTAFKYAPWRPGIHLKQKDARVYLEVIDVWVQRLQDITEEEAVAEGIKWNNGTPQSGYGVNGSTKHVYAISAFQELWENIHGAENWRKNPYVFRYTFKLLSTTGMTLLVQEALGHFDHIKSTEL